MSIFKLKYRTKIMLFLVGMAYFCTMSNWEINYFYKSIIFMLPLQLASIIYITYLRWSHR